MSEFTQIAYTLINEKLGFLSSEWRGKFEGELSGLLARIVRQYTSKENNTALREACRSVVALADHTLTVLPSNAKACRCAAFDNGDDRAQPICHVCAIHQLRSTAVKALE
jgi:hypothetical protein